MFTSIDDVTPIDSNEVGNRVADFLQTTGQIMLITMAAVFVLYLVIAIVIAKKAGYSGWWGALAVLVPPLGVLLALLEGRPLEERKQQREQHAERRHQYCERAPPTGVPGLLRNHNRDD
ncbi:MAG TPA: hypothetical protein VFC06_00580 [Demequina sp.]|nr:hypothetical protein [Demequina sp.]